MFQDGSVRTILSESRTLRWASRPQANARRKHSFAIQTTPPAMAQSTSTPKGECYHSSTNASVPTTVEHHRLQRTRQHVRAPVPSFSGSLHLRTELILTNPAAQIVATPTPQAGQRTPKRLTRPTRAPERHVNMLPHITCSKRFSSDNFKHFLTLFSKFFSSFPHGTCSLSVSHKYLALDEIYHPLCTSIPRSTTLRTEDRTQQAPCNRRDSHPL